MRTPSCPTSAPKGFSHSPHPSVIQAPRAGEAGLNHSATGDSKMLAVNNVY